MATFNLELRGTSDTKPHSIILKIRFSKTNLTWPTGLKVLPAEWNPGKQIIKKRSDRVELNKKLGQVISYAEEYYNSLVITNEPIDRYSLRNGLDDRFKAKRIASITFSSFVVPLLTQFIDTAPERIILKLKRPISESSLKTYKRTLNHLIGFENYAKKKFRFQDLNEDYHTDLIFYLESKKELAALTINGVIKNIKTIANFAQRKGVSVNPFVFTREFYRPTEDGVKPIYLNEEEISILFRKDFSYIPHLENARDLFVIGLRTGLRLSDFSRLKPENIAGGLIRITQKKTGEEIVIPLHPQVQSILSKRGGKLPSPISDQKFNLYIKQICSIAGFTQEVMGAKVEKIGVEKNRQGRKVAIKRKNVGMFPKFELVTSHICRRSFATNLYGKLPMLTIMAITGHKSEKTFLHYIKKTPDDYAQELRKFWEKESQFKS